MKSGSKTFSQLTKKNSRIININGGYETSKTSLRGTDTIDEVYLGMSYLSFLDLINLWNVYHSKITLTTLELSPNFITLPEISSHISNLHRQLQQTTCDVPDQKPSQSIALSNASFLAHFYLKSICHQCCTHPTFFHRDILVICPIIVLKYALRVFTSLPYQTLRPHWLKFFLVI